jgi:hypothetical protein
MRLTPPAAVNLWTAGFATAAVVQGLFARRFALGTPWGYSKGWQREIAIWNLGTLTTVAALRRGLDADRSLIAGFSVLSALFGVNHLDAALRFPRSWSNWLGASANTVALVTGLGALATESRR